MRRNKVKKLSEEINKILEPAQDFVLRKLLTMFQLIHKFIIILQNQNLHGKHQYHQSKFQGRYYPAH